MKSKKVVLITGTSTGMGRSMAILLADQGYSVYAGSRTPEMLPTSLDTTLYPIKLDITDSESIKKAISQIPQIDILINNAGYGLVSTVEDMNEEEMIDQFDINVFGLLRVTKSVIPIMRASGGGVIINVSSFLGKIGLPLLTAYNSSKYAVEGITDSLRYELRDFGIRVHSILPGFFDTEFARTNLVVNSKLFDKHSPYQEMVSTLAPTIIEQINGGNDANEVAKMIVDIIEDSSYPARATVGDKASKFIPMRRELSDEDFERRVRESYSL